MDDDNIKKYTIRLHNPGTGEETFNSCTEIDASADQLTFTDRNGKTHEVYGVSYHIAEE